MLSYNYPQLNSLLKIAIILGKFCRSVVSTFDRNVITARDRDKGNLHPPRHVTDTLVNLFAQLRHCTRGYAYVHACACAGGGEGTIGVLTQSFHNTIHSARTSWQHFLSLSLSSLSSGIIVHGYDKERCIVSFLSRSSDLSR